MQDVGFRKIIDVVLRRVRDVITVRYLFYPRVRHCVLSGRLRYVSRGEMWKLGSWMLNLVGIGGVGC